MPFIYTAQRPFEYLENVHIHEQSKSVDEALLLRSIVPELATSRIKADLDSELKSPILLLLLPNWQGFPCLEKTILQVQKTISIIHESQKETRTKD
jgi:hypothetical protein